MRRAALAAAAVVLAGCGGSARTVTVTRTQPSTTTTGTASASAAPARAAACDAPCAAKVVAGRGYTANPSTYDPSRPLNVLLGVRTRSTDGTAQNAFFFWQGRYIGTDTADNSAGIRFQSASGDTVTLVYRLYNPKDPQCCSTAGEATVRYRYSGSRLVPLDPIPPSAYSARGSRR